MDNIELIDATATDLRVRHNATGHVFTYRAADGDLMPGTVEEGPGPKEPGDVAADVHAFAKREAKRRGMI